MTGPSRPSLLLGALLGVLALAPTPGDIGGCGQPVEELDRELFFASLRAAGSSRTAVPRS